MHKNGVKEQYKKTVEVKAKDGITLKGTEYLQDQQTNKWGNNIAWI